MGQVNELKDFTRGQIDAALMKIGQDAGMNTADGIRAFLAGELVISKVVKEVALGTFRLTIDYNLSLEQVIAAGHYDWKNDDITAKRFPVVGEGTDELEARYFHFNHNISSEDAVKEIEQTDKENPWMPAKIEHMLSFGAIFPDEQRKFPIIGLGSVAEVDGSRCVPCLSRDGSGRHLDLYWWDFDWYSIYRFLAVRKVSVP